MLNLMIPGTVVKKEIEGEIFHIKVMSPYQAVEWANLIDESSSLIGLDMMIEKIVKIEGREESPAEILKILNDTKQIKSIIMGIIGANSLEDDEVKN